MSLIDSEIVGTAIKCLFEMKKDLEKINSNF